MRKDKQIELFIKLVFDLEENINNNTTDFIKRKCNIAISRNKKLYMDVSKLKEVKNKIKEVYGVEFIGLENNIKKCGYYILDSDNKMK